MSNHHTSKCALSSCSIVTRSSKRKLNQNIGPETKPNVDPQSSVAPTQLKVKGRKTKQTKIDQSSPVPSVSPKCWSRNRSSLDSRSQLNFSDLTGDVLEQVARYLDTDSAVSLLRTCRTVYQKLVENGSFWKHLCRNENFHEYAALKTNDPECEVETESDTDTNEDSKRSLTKSKARSCKRRKFQYVKGSRHPTKIVKRLSWSGEPFHDVRIDKDSTLWRKIFMRGIQMRRNICDGRFELWRLFLTDADSLPVKKMSFETTFRELRSSHRRSPFNHPSRRIKINRYWNEDFLIAIQHSAVHRFCDIFVWGWNECQNPKFLYSHSFQQTYPEGLYPTAFFLWKNYLVLMPDVDCSREERSVRSMIRVHDLSENMKLSGSWDFPENTSRKRIIKAKSDFSPCNDVAHLHKVQNKAVALCRAPNLSLFVFNLPDCQLIQEVPLLFCPEHPLELDDLDQRFFIRDNSLIFMFHDKDFFGTLMTLDDEAPPPTQKFGRVLFVDFDQFLIDNNNPVDVMIDNKFDSNDDFIEKVSVINKTCFALALNSGKVVVRDIVSTTKGGCVHHDRLVIDCPEDLKVDYDSDLGGEVDTDGPNIVASRDGDRILVMRHFESGRQIHAYDINKKGKLIYTIDIDRWSVGLNREPGHVSVDMDGCFVCAADLNKIVVWNSKNGKMIRSIQIPAHYNVQDDRREFSDTFGWKGHTDFAFAEDGIIIVHSRRNFPVAADVMLFW